MIDSDKVDLRSRAGRLGLHGMLARWDEFGDAPWLRTVLDCEAEERQKRSLLRRIHNARLGAYKPLADFDWSWPTKIDREAIEEMKKILATAVIVKGEAKTKDKKKENK